MGAIPERKTISKKPKSSSNSYILIAGVLGAIFALGLAYMTLYVAPEETLERVKVVAVTEAGCIVETFDGFAFNIGQCNEEPEKIITAPVDQKVKERALAMNPS